MERGLLWLPLLVLFFWLAWAGWNEYNKLEAYKLWAEPFERAKYDIRSVLAQTGMELKWGVPARTAPKNVQTFSLKDIKNIQLVVDGRVADLTNPPTKGKTINLEFICETQPTIVVPFTQVDLASQWATVLQQDLQNLT